MPQFLRPVTDQPELIEMVDRHSRNMGIDFPVNVMNTDLGIIATTGWNKKTGDLVIVNPHNFNHLKQDEREFIIAHELSHIKNQDGPRNRSSTGLRMVSLAAPVYALAGASPEAAFISLLGYGTHFALDMIGNRHAEHRADIHAAQTIGNANGGINNLQKFKDEVDQMPEPESLEDRLKTSIMKAMSYHPSLEERINCLKNWQERRNSELDGKPPSNQP